MNTGMNTDMIFKTKPYRSDRPWGYELWNLSTHRSGQSEVLPEGEKLGEYLGKKLPVLIKLIKADDALSVQVHPDDVYARAHENDNGKTECWYILEAKPGARLIAGIHPGLDRDKMEDVIAKNKLEDVFEYIDVKPGDMVYIPAGTLHAITGGLKLFEIQESSDSTYRIYDWGRDRETNIEKALDVIDYTGKNGAGKIENFKKLETPYFHVEKVVSPDEISFHVDEDFQTVNIISGTGTVISGDEADDFGPEETIYIPHGKDYKIVGDVQFLRTW